MMKIGDVAKQFNISSRTLRYWEEAGILDSSRMENGYRFYNDESETRIRQIVLLRKLKMPIASIEKVFIRADYGAARNELTRHLENLKRDAALYNSLIKLTEMLLQKINGSRNLEQIFHHLETQSKAIGQEQKEASNIQLSERGSKMFAEQLSNVRIVRIPAMTVASYRAESAMPEEDCARVFNKFVLDNNLHKKGGYRYFGFNNPDPREDKAEYGYEMWVSIPEDFPVPAPLTKKQYGGGQYASISAQMSEIGERWKLLYDWCKTSEKYDVDSSLQWLEECTMDFEAFISEKAGGPEKQLDLLEPVKNR